MEHFLDRSRFLSHSILFSKLGHQIFLKLFLKEGVKKWVNVTVLVFQENSYFAQLGETDYFVSKIDDLFEFFSVEFIWSKSGEKWMLQISKENSYYAQSWVNQGLLQKLRTASGRCKKGHFFTTKKVKKGTPNLTPPPLFIASLHFFLIKQIFEKISHQGQRPEVGLSFNLK